MLFVVLFLRDGATRPGYRASYHPVSALALGPRGWLQTGNFVISGALIATAAPAVWTVTGLRVLPLLVGAFGVGLVASGIFPMDPMRGYPPGTPTGDPKEFSASHRWHDRFGVPVFALLPAMPAVGAFTFGHLGWQVASGIVAVATAVFTVKFSTAWERDDPQTGLWQRLALAGGMLWLAAFCAWLTTA